MGFATTYPTVKHGPEQKRYCCKVFRIQSKKLILFNECVITLNYSEMIGYYK